MARYPYLTFDVFTQNRFGGNQLAVLPDARGLSTAQMQAITREFNFAESTFVLPPSDPANDAQVRIFTPMREMPFAGHPNVGTAFALAHWGHVHGRPVADTLRFEEIAGLVVLQLQRDADGTVTAAELTAPAKLELLGEAPISAVTAAAGLKSRHLVTTNHAPMGASVGAPFTLAEVSDLDALASASPNSAAFDAHFHNQPGDAIFLYTRTGTNAVQARMFAPRHGVFEDPATGSASAALIGLLAHLAPERDGTFPLSITQGVEMGRPSLITGAADKVGGQVTAVRVGGPSVLVMEGTLTV